MPYAGLMPSMIAIRAAQLELPPQQRNNLELVLARARQIDALNSPNARSSAAADPQCPYRDVPRRPKAQ